MVKITFSEDTIKVSCSQCVNARSLSTSHFFGEIDAIMQLCPKCFGDLLVEKIRQFQRNEGNPDCFAKSNGYCVRRACKFYSLCTDRRYF